MVTNAGGPVDGPDQTFTTPLIDSEFASKLGSEAATLNAELKTFASDPAKYHFEYGESASYGASTSEGELASQGAAGDSVVSAAITGLHPETTYHYRVVVKVGEGSGNGPDKTFTTGAAPTFQLPDNRAYEMVTPVNKGAAFIEGLSEGGGMNQTSTDGNALAFSVDGAFGAPEGNRSFESEQALAERTSGGWQSQEIVTPNEHAFGAGLGNRNEYQFFTPDLALSVVQPFPLGFTPAAEPPLSPPADRSRTWPSGKRHLHPFRRSARSLVRGGRRLQPSEGAGRTVRRRRPQHPGRGAAICRS